MEQEFNKTQEFNMGEVDKSPNLNTLKGFLEKLAYWGRFFGVLAYIFGVGCLFILYSLLEGYILTSGLGSLLGMIILFVLIYFFATYFYDFSKETYVYIKDDNLKNLESGLSNLASVFKLSGVLIIISLVFFVLMGLAMFFLISSTML